VPFWQRFLLVWAFNVAAIWVASKLLDGIDYQRFWHLIVAGLVFAIVNALIKPIVTLLALPAIILTLGIAYFFVNLLMLYVTSWITPGFKVDGFWDAVLGTVIIWAVNVVLRAIFDIDGRRRRRRAARAR
jgi:putative membrane protein